MFSSSETSHRTTPWPLLAILNVEPGATSAAAQLWAVVAVVVLPTGLENTYLGTFGESWFRSMCAVAGCTVAVPYPDVDGVDFIVGDSNSERISVQVKTVSANSAEAGRDFSYPLGVGAYNQLRQGATHAYLVVVRMYAPHPRWTGHYRSGSLVRASAHFADLTGRPATSNTTSVTVDVRAADLLDPGSLQALFAKYASV